MEKQLIIFIDSGDTLIDEGTEKRDERGVVYEANFIQGGKEVLEYLYNEGYRLALVADGLVESFDNMYDKQHKIGHVFDTRTISEALEVEKPHPLMFETALKNLGLQEEDKKRIIMVGNNIKRDILGANKLGITSVLLSWSPRYNMIPQNQEETPDYIIQIPRDLIELVEILEQNIRQPK